MTSLLLFALFSATSTAAADTPVRMTAGYYGDFVSHPGAYAGATWQIAQAGPVSALGGFELGAYHHRRNHTGAFARGTFGTRWTAGSGAFVEPRFVAGYLHTWVDADGHWMVDDITGSLRAADSSGSPNLVYGFGVGGGWQLGEADRAALTVRAETLGRAPYYGFVLNQFALLAGVEWKLGGGAR